MVNKPTKSKAPKGKMTEKKDAKLDKKKGVKEGSKKDVKLDKKAGLAPDGFKTLHSVHETQLKADLKSKGKLDPAKLQAALRGEYGPTVAHTARMHSILTNLKQS